MFFFRSGIPYTHIASPMPQVYRSNNAIPPRGVSNRRAALAWIRNYVKSGVVYFGDDDNTFDLKLFDEIRSTKKISMFPVGLIGSYGISSPVLRKVHISPRVSKSLSLNLWNKTTGSFQPIRCLKQS